MIQLLFILASSWSGFSVRNVPPVLGAGGPDAYGYRYIDSDTSAGNPPAYRWLSIRDIGTQIQGLRDDNVVGPFSIGFDFPYYWYHVSSIYVGSNGYIAFGDNGLAALPFHSFPSRARPNDVVGVLEADLIYGNRPGNPGKAWYWTNSANDTFVLECDSVPFWFSGSQGDTGANTFEIILSRPDSSLTFQYRLQRGFPPGSSPGWWPTNDAVGIENVSGQVGLSYLDGNIPSGNMIHESLAVRFYPPETSSMVEHDCAVWRAMNEDNAGIFLLPNVATALWAKVKNTGNRTENSVRVYCRITNDSGRTVYADTVTTGQLSPEEVDSLSFSPQWAPATTGQYVIRVISNLSGDMVRGNDTVYIETHVVDYPAELSYDRGRADYMTTWTGSNGGGYGDKFIAPAYPLEVSEIKAYLQDSVRPVTCTLWLFAANGPNGSPGTVLGRGDIPVDLDTAAWYSLNFDPAVVVDSGGFFVGVTSDGYANPLYGMDTIRPISGRTWEYTGSWSPARDAAQHDVMMHAVVRSVSTGDVGVTAILSPSGVIDSSQSVTPACSVYNYGTTTVSYSVRMKIGSSYNATATVSAHSPGTYRMASFPVGSRWPRGALAVSCSTELAQDTRSANDRQTGSVRVRVIDAGTAEVLAPPDSVDLGATIAPEAIVANLGTDTASFRFCVGIGGEYADSVNLTDLSPGHSQDVTFSPWTPLRPGSFACRCSAALSGDLNPGNNAMTRRVHVRGRDVSPEILAPTGILDSGAVVTPRAKVRNSGSITSAFPVWFRIEMASAPAEPECTMLSKNEHPGIVALATVYLDSVWLTVPPYDSALVDFATWIATPSDTYRLVAFTDLAHDTVRTNDTDKAQIVVGPARHDVGVTRILSPMRWAVLGDTVIPQAEVRNYGWSPEVFAVRFQIGSSYSQDIIDTALPAARDTVQFEPWVAEPEGIYAVACSTELAGDMTPGNDRIRDSVRVLMVGIGESDETGALTRRLRFDGVLPNPSFGPATIAYNTQRDCAVALRIFTAAGTLVRRLETGVQKAGPHRLVWDGSDGWGRAAGRGIYFCRLDAGGMSAETKFVRVK